jgi:spoIIIJ-associated protein
MRTVEKVGKTPDDAITEALIELGVTRDQVDIEIIEKGSKGFLLGLGSKDARVRVTVKPMYENDNDELNLNDTANENEKKKKQVDKLASKDEKEISSDNNKLSESDSINITEEELTSIENNAKRFLEKLVKEMGIEAEVASKVSNKRIYLSISGKNMGIIIGKRGETLDAIQYLVNIVANKGRDEYVKIVLDTENYRERREETLKKLANRLAKKAVQTRRVVVLEPMNPYDRRIIHSALQDNKNVRTHSEGKEPFRKVVISPINSKAYRH